MSEKKQNQNTDIFAAIGNERVKYREENLRAQEAPPRPTNKLPIKNALRNSQKWRLTKKIYDHKTLLAELEKQRSKHSIYLQKLCPEIKNYRTSLPLKNFQWRIETEEDKKDFQSILDGKGEWTNVSIPHYGPPLGRAVTYYRTQFTLTEDFFTKGSLFLCFDGADYKAHVFLNGVYLGSHEGFFAPFEFECIEHARHGTNVLLVKLENDAICMGNESWGEDGNLYDGDKIYAATGLGYDDPEVGWHHCPPGMGIYQPVRIEARSRQFIHDIFVRPLPGEIAAEAWIEMWNCDILARPAELSISIYGRNFKKCVCKDVRYKLTGPLYPRLNQFRVKLDMKDFRYWEPATPWLYQIQVELISAENEDNSTPIILDSAEKQFGMRSFYIDSTHKPYGKIFLNGKEIRLRGANTMGFEQQDVAKGDFDRLIDDILLAKICNMNFLRLTQRPVQREVYEFCDRLGMMLQTDLPLFGMLTRLQFCEAVRQAREMEHLIRSHPSSILVSYINEPFPASWKPAKQMRVLTREELERFFSACDQAVLLENPDRAIKPVDGDYDPPEPGLPDNHCYCCWYNGHGIPIGKLHRGEWMPTKPDWNCACGEFGAEGLEAVETMRKYYPKSWLPQTAEEEKSWRANRIPKSQTEKFHYCWFDTQEKLEDWITASQKHQEWATKIMTEALRRNNRMVSFAIHLFIDAFPAGWMKTIMDVDRIPKKAFFAYMDALSPVMTSLRSDRITFFSGEKIQVEAWISNDTHETFKNSKLEYQFETENSVIANGQIKPEIPICSSKCIGLIEIPAPEVQTRTKTALKILLRNSQGKIIHHNELKIDIFPRDKTLIHNKIVILGNKNGISAKFAKELGIKPSFIKGNEKSISNGNNKTTILIDDINLLNEKMDFITKAVNSGATVIALELENGKIEFSKNNNIQIRNCPMGPVVFVSRKTGHPLVSDFEPEDFKFWFEPSADCTTSILERVCVPEQSSAWNTILNSGGPSGDWFDTGGIAMPAVIERTEGKGRWIVCQLKLAGHLINPVAAIFAKKILSC